MANHARTEALLDLAMRGDLSIIGRDYKNAVKIYTEVLSERELLAQEDKRGVVYHRGKAYLFLEQFQSAIHDFDEALSPSCTGPKSSTEVTGLIYIHRAASLRRLGRITESQDSYNKFKELASVRGYPLSETRGAAIYKELVEDDDDDDDEEEEDANLPSHAGGSRDTRDPKKPSLSSGTLSAARYNGSTIMFFDDAHIGFFDGEDNMPKEVIISAPFLKYPSYGRKTRRSFKLHLAMRDGIFVNNYIRAVFQRAELDAVGDSEDVEEFKKMARVHRDVFKSSTYIVTEQKRVLQVPSTAMRRELVQSSLWPLPPYAMRFTNWNQKVKLGNDDGDAPKFENGCPVLHVIPEDKIDEWIESLEKEEPPKADGTADLNTFMAALIAMALVPVSVCSSNQLSLTSD